MIQGGRKAGDKDLKEKRKLKKKAAENRLKVLGEALGHVDDEDGVLVQVYDDIQEELRVKTEALKKSKLRVRILIEYTVKPVYKDHPREQKFVAVVYRLFRCNFILFKLKLDPKIVVIVDKWSLLGGGR